MKKSNSSSSELSREDWVAENLILLSNDPRESSFGLEEQIICDKIGDISPKDDEANVYLSHPKIKKRRLMMKTYP